MGGVGGWAGLRWFIVRLTIARISGSLLVLQKNAGSHTGGWRQVSGVEAYMLSYEFSRN